MRENILNKDQSTGRKVSESSVRQARGRLGAQHAGAELTFLSLATGKAVKDHSEGLPELPGNSQAGSILGKRKRWL